MGLAVMAALVLPGDRVGMTVSLAVMVVLAVSVVAEVTAAEVEEVRA